MATSIQTASAHPSSNESWYQYAVRNPMGLIADKIDAFMSSTSLPFPENLKNCSKQGRVYEIVKLAMIGNACAISVGALSLLVIGSPIILVSFGFASAVYAGASVLVLSSIIKNIRQSEENVLLGEQQESLAEVNCPSTELEDPVAEQQDLVTEMGRLNAERQDLVTEMDRLNAELQDLVTEMGRIIG